MQWIRGNAAQLLPHWRDRDGASDHPSPMVWLRKFLPRQMIDEDNAAIYTCAEMLMMYTFYLFILWDTAFVRARAYAL